MTTPTAAPLRRSAHFVPGANERMLHKALATAADTLILDLEDAVTPQNKDSARRTVADWLHSVDFGVQERTVRMNPLASPWGLKDMEATMEAPPDNYVVPKVSTLDELMAIDAQLTELESRYGHPTGGVGLILVATETPLGALNLPTFSACPRVRALSWGAEDLSAALGAPRNRRPDGSYLDTYRYCRVQTLLAAGAGNVQPIDTVFVDIRDSAALAAECEEAAWMGYTGKITIHPDQIDIVNAAFTPAEAVVAEAQELLALFEEEQAAGRMAFSFRGQMVDAPHLERARRIVARAAQIEARSGTAPGTG
ncbi:MAG: CoA ester lyase [Pseudomonadota bacterium]